MKTINETKTVEQTSTFYEANDGTRFTDKSECEIYEKTAQCAIIAQFNNIATSLGISETIFWDTSGDVEIFKVNPTTSLHEEILLKLISLYKWSDKHFEEDSKTIHKAVEEHKTVIMYKSYDSYGLGLILEDYIAKLQKFTINETH